MLYDLSTQSPIARRPKHKTKMFLDSQEALDRNTENVRRLLWNSCILCSGRLCVSLSRLSDSVQLTEDKDQHWREYFQEFKFVMINIRWYV